MAYKNMDFKKYAVGTILLYSSAILGAVLISDIGIIFQFLMPFATISIAFVIPAALYLKADQ